MTLPRETTAESIFDVAFSPCGLEVLLALGRIALVPVSGPTLCHWTLNVERWAFGVCCLRRERFLIHHVRHFRRIAAVVTFEDVDKSLDAAASHAFVWIDIEAGDLRTAGKMMEHAAAIGDLGIEQRRIGRERFLFENVERRAGDNSFF